MPEQRIRQLRYLDDKCPSCNCDAMVLATVAVYNPTQSVLLSQTIPTNQNGQITAVAKPKYAYVLCIACLHREKWIIDEVNPSSFTREIIADGNEISPREDT